MWNFVMVFMVPKDKSYWVQWSPGFSCSTTTLTVLAFTEISTVVWIDYFETWHRYQHCQKMPGFVDWLLLLYTGSQPCSRGGRERAPGPGGQAEAWQEPRGQRNTCCIRTTTRNPGRCTTYPTNTHLTHRSVHATLGLGVGVGVGWAGLYWSMRTESQGISWLSCHKMDIWPACQVRISVVLKLL